MLVKPGELGVRSRFLIVDRIAVDGEELHLRSIAQIAGKGVVECRHVPTWMRPPVIDLRLRVAVMVVVAQ